MKDDYTHISIILDRTGSIESIRDDTIKRDKRLELELQRWLNKSTTHA